MDLMQQRTGSLFLLAQGIALFGGSRVLDIDGLAEAGIGLAVLGALLLWGGRRESTMPGFVTRREYIFYSGIGLAALALTLAALPSSGEFFRRFIGAANPIVVAAVASVVGAGALYVLRSRFGFKVLGHETLRGIGVSAAFATVLGVAIVIADITIRYPQDMNAPMPQALLFYPAIGFVAEIAFHILPLALVLLALSPLVGRLGEERVVWIGIMTVAALEPTFQILFEGNALAWGDLYTWIHVFAIAATQLYVFRRYDFASMYSFRLIYYAYWHILWGVIRLDVLF